MAQIAQEAVQASTSESTEMKALVISMLEEKNKEGFERGEVKSFCERLSKETDFSVSTIRGWLYHEVRKNNSPDETSEQKAEEKLKPIKLVAETYCFDTKDFKLLTENDQSFYLVKHVHDALNVQKNSPLVKNVIKREFKTLKEGAEYYTILGLTILLNNIIDKHSMVETRNKAKRLLDFSKMDRKNFYNKGDLVPVKVTRIDPTRLIKVESTDGLDMKGMVHISEVRDDEFIHDLEDLFDVDDELKVRVNTYEIGKGWNFSTKGLLLPKKTAIAKQLQKLNLEVPIMPEGEIIQTTIPFNGNKEMEKVRSKFSIKINAISPNVEQELDGLVTEHGIGDVREAIARAEEKFIADLGWWKLQLLKKELERL